MILLDAGILVVDVQGGGDVLRPDPGTEPSRRPAGDLAPEDQLHFFWAAAIKVFADNLFEEQASVRRPIEHLGQ